MSTLTSTQNEMLNQLLSLTQDQVGKPDPYQFQGNRVAPLGALTQQGLGMTGQFGQQGANTVQQLLNPNQGMGLDAIFQQGMDQFGAASEQIANKFGGLDATSSSVARDAQNRALQQFMTASQAQAIPAQLQANAQNLQSKQLGLGAMPGLQALMFGGGGVEQGQNQSLINEQIQAMLRQNPLLSQAFGTGAGLAGMGTLENVAMGQGAGLGYAGVAGILGGASQGAMQGAAMAAAGSDKRLKTDIKTAFVRDGIRFVTWTWNEKAEELGLKGKSFGVIAQEIQAEHPEAVVEMDNGYLGVDYSKLGE